MKQSIMDEIRSLGASSRNVVYSSDQGKTLRRCFFVYHAKISVREHSFSTINGKGFYYLLKYKK